MKSGNRGLQQYISSKIFSCPETLANNSAKFDKSFQWGYDFMCAMAAYRCDQPKQYVLKHCLYFPDSPLAQKKNAIFHNFFHRAIGDPVIVCTSEEYWLLLTDGNSCTSKVKGTNNWITNGATKKVVKYRIFLLSQRRVWKIQAILKHILFGLITSVGSRVYYGMT